MLDNDSHVHIFKMSYYTSVMGSQNLRGGIGFESESYQRRKNWNLQLLCAALHIKRHRIKGSKIQWDGCLWLLLFAHLLGNMTSPFE